MDAAEIKLSIYDNRPLNFSGLCEAISSRSSAEELTDFVLANSLTVVDIEFAGMALIHSGHMDLGEKVFEQKFDEAKRDKAKNAGGSLRDFSILCVHSAFIHLQKVVNGENPDENMDKATKFAGEANSLHARASLPLLAQGFCHLLKDGQDHLQFKHASDLFGFANVDHGAGYRSTLVDRSGLTKLGMGISAFHLENYDEAKNCFRDVLRWHANALPMVRLALGQTLMALGRSNDATFAFKAALDKSENNVVALTALALLGFNSLELDGAIAYLKRALQADPTYGPAIVVEAALYFYLGKPNKVIKKLKAVTVGKDRKIAAEVLYQAARFTHFKGDIEKARERYTNAVEKNPAHARANFALALLAADEGKSEEAVKYCAAAERELHEYFELNAVMGLAHAELSQRLAGHHGADAHYKSAINYLGRAIEVSEARKADPEEVVKVYRTLGWLYIKSLQFKEAEEVFSKASVLTPTPDDELLLFLGITQFERKDKFDVALATLERCENQENPILRFNIGRCLEELNRFDKAHDIYTKLAEDFPSFAEPLLRLAAMALRDTRPGIENREAKRYLTTIVDDIPGDNVHAWLELGNVNARTRRGLADAATAMVHVTKGPNRGSDGYLYATVALGNYKLTSAQTKKDQGEIASRLNEAQRCYIQALKENPKCVAAANGIALCWLLSGRVSAAKEQLRLVKDFGPDMAASFENLGHAHIKEGQFQAAKTRFEEANGKFYDKTDFHLLIQTFYAAKSGGNYEECMAVAEQLCALRPENIMHWYLLATSIDRAVLGKSSSRSVDQKLLRESVVRRWLKQENRAVALLNAVLDRLPESLNETTIREKIERIEGPCMKRLQVLLKIAIDNDERRRELVKREAESYEQVEAVGGPDDE